MGPGGHFQTTFSQMRWHRLYSICACYMWELLLSMINADKATFQALIFISSSAGATIIEFCEVWVVTPGRGVGRRRLQGGQL